MLNLDPLSSALLIISGLSTGAMLFLRLFSALERMVLAEKNAASGSNYTACSQGCFSLSTILIIGINVALWGLRFWLVK